MSNFRTIDRQTGRLRAMLQCASRERFEIAPPVPKYPTPVEAMAHRLRTPDGKDLYALANKLPNRCSASSKRRSDSVNSLTDHRRIC
jgi:hypothetical protein